MQKNESKLSKKFVIMLASFSIVFVIAMLGIVYYSTNGIVKMILANNNISVSEYIADNLDIEGLEQLAQNPVEGPLFYEQQQQLAEFLDANKLTYAFVMMPGADGLENRILVDGSPIDEEDTYMIGDESDGLNYEEIAASVQDGSVYEYAHFDGWGDFLSVYVPLKNADGETFAILATDEQIDFVTSFQNNAFLKSLPVMGAVIFVITLIVIGLIFANVISFLRPIKEMRVAASNLDSGDLKATVDQLNAIKLDANDDVGSFGVGFKTALEKLGDMIKTLTTMSKDIEHTTDDLRIATVEVQQTQKTLHTRAFDIQSSIEKQMDLSAQSTEVMDGMHGDMQMMIRSVNAIQHSLQATSSLVNSSAKEADIIADKVQNVAGHVEKTSEQVKDLASRYVSIEEMISVIQNIAEDTKLLALNAAIEAANAGEDGEGFSVIAEEVKSLSTITKEAAEDIRMQILQFKELTQQMLEDMEDTTDDVQTGAQLVTDINSNLQQVLSATDVVQNNVQEVSQTAKQMEASAATMNRELAQVEKHSDGINDNTALVVESVELQEQSFIELSETVGDLKESLTTLEKTISKYSVL